MLRVIYTPDIFSLQRIGGISRYFCELIARAPSHGGSANVVAGIHFNQHLRRLSRNAGFYVPKLGPLGNSRLNFNQALCRRVAAMTPAAVVHFTYYSDVEYPKSHPVVFTVHDMIDELFPGHSTAVPPGLKRRNCERADHIIAVSAVTKKDLIDIFEISPDKITVIHHGESLSATTTHDLKSNSERYLLYVGVREGYKNFARFLEAFAASAFLKDNFNVIAFGGGPFSEDETESIERLEVTHKVRQVMGDDMFLSKHYRNATVLVFPSLYEGFGLPVVEAMGQGCPVICSEPGGSLSEIAGDAAAYFDPNDAANIRLVLEQTLNDSDRLAELRRRGAARHKLFSWDKCAQQTTDVYRRVTEQYAGKASAVR